MAVEGRAPVVPGGMFWIGLAVLAPGLMDGFGAFAHDYVESVAGAGVARSSWYRARPPEEISRLGSFLAEDGDDYGGAATAAAPVVTGSGEAPA